MPPLFRDPSCVFGPAEDGYHVYHIAADRLHHLNPTAALLFELCDGSRDREALLDAIAPLLGDDARDACDAWLGGAIRDGLIAAVPPDIPPWTAAALSARADQLDDRGGALASYLCRRRAAEIEPGCPRHWYRLGEAAQGLGRRDEAREAYRRYLDACPDDAEIRQILTALRDEPPPGRAPDRCITQIYARFAASYESCMLDDLDYQAPERLGEAIEGQLGSRAGLDVLELGCGTGLFAKVLRPRAANLVGVDLSPEMLEQARRRGCYDALELAEITAWLDSARPGRFDLIAACDTLIYFGDLRQVLAPAAGRLRPGGHVAFTLERADRPPFALTDSGRYAHHADHVRDAAADAGLEVVHLAEHLLRYEYDEPVIGLIAVLRAGRGGESAAGPATRTQSQ